MLSSHPAWGAWIEISSRVHVNHVISSHPAWGAWIEIATNTARTPYQKSHPAWGAWIEIGYTVIPYFEGGGRTPHGVRGLKYQSTCFHAR